MAIALQTATRQKRGMGSCMKCRSLKIRCSRHKPQCERCQHRGLDCVYLSKRRNPQTASQPEDSSTQVPSPGSPIPQIEDNGSPPDGELQPAPSMVGEPIGIEASQPSASSSTTLPPISTIRELGCIYFSRVHPLRCLGFIHKPTFMRCLDQGCVTAEYSEALILIICAFGNRYKFHSSTQMAYTSIKEDDIPGNIWAKQAMEKVFREIGYPSTHNLMALVLLCEYNMRWGRQSTAIMMATCCSQMSRLLRLDAQGTYNSLKADSTFKSQLEQQTLTRLFWSCYILDLLIASGVESLTNMKISPKIPLPSSQQSFALGTSCSSQLLAGQLECTFPDEQTVSLGMEAYFLRLLYLRAYILKLIRQTESHTDAWLDHSDFYRPVKGLKQWIDGLPEHLAFNQLNIYIQRDQQQLSTFYTMHLLFHQTFCDLYRVALPGYRFPIKQALRNAPREFLVECQNECLQHADAISLILQNSMQHGPESLDDPICGACIYESTKIQVIIGRSCSPGLPIEGWARILQNVSTNLDAMDKCCTHLGWGIFFMTSLCSLLDQFNVLEITTPWKQKYGSSQESSDVCPTTDNHHLHPLSTYQMAWKEVKTTQNTRSQDPEQLCLDRQPINRIPFVPADLNHEQTQVQFDAPLAQVYYTQVATELEDYISWHPFSLSTDDPTFYMGP